MSAAGPGRPAQYALAVIATVLAVGALHVARSAVVPVLFAVFLALLLSPAVAGLTRWHVPRALAAAIVVAALVTLVALALNATWRPARNWLDAAPATIRTLERKLRPVTRVIAKVESVSQQAGRVADPAVAVDAAGPSTAAGAADKSTMRNTTEWLVASVTVLIIAYFLLAGGPPLLVRLEALRSEVTGARLLPVASAISSDLGRYFATVTLSNLLLGVGTALTMHWLGMPNALLWGAVAFLLNYVPYAGSATTLVLLTAVALVSFDGLSRAFAVAGTYLVLTTIEGQILQPILVGRRLDVHPLVVLLSLWFGGWLWGVAGVALAMPLVVTAKALAMELAAARAKPGATPKDASTVRSRALDFLAGSPARHRRPEAERR